MNIIGSRMKQRRKELKMSGAVLAERLGVIRNTISRWERGERKPNMTKLSAIASALETSTAYLLGVDAGNGESQQLSLLDTTTPVPVYKIKEIVTYNITMPTDGEMLEVDQTLLLPKNIFGSIDTNRRPLAIIMPNNSMQGANMNEGDMVIINPAAVVNNGDPALVIYNGIPMLRWVCYKANGDIELQAANPNHNSIIVEARYKEGPEIVRVIGRSVMAITQKDLKSAF